MASPETVLAEFNIVPVIIVLIVIGKIIKTLKDAASNGSAAPSKPVAARKQKLEEDLERFFERLGTQNSPTEAAAPPPVPPAAARSIPKAKPAATQAALAQPKREPKRARPVAAEEYAPKVTPLRPAPPLGGLSYSLQASVPKGATCSYGTTAARKEIVAMMRDDKSIRKAILLREILGPPVSMRG